MMKTTIPINSNLKELYETIESLRMNKFSDVPEKIVFQIISLEDKFIDLRPEALKQIEKLVDDLLKE